MGLILIYSAALLKIMFDTAVLSNFIAALSSAVTARPLRWLLSGRRRGGVEQEAPP